MTPIAAGIRAEIDALADADHALFVARYFKTGPGEYGEGDVFIGVRAPALRAVARRHGRAELPDLGDVISSPVHEHRFVALAILDERATRLGRVRTDIAEHERLARFYLDHADRVDNWDLVDCSAPRVLGGWLVRRPAEAAADTARLLDDLSSSPVLWRRRIAVMASWGFIRAGRLDVTFGLVQRLGDDPQDLMHKAMGWMLRESGKVDEAALLAFLDAHPALPRTTVRYAIERLAPEVRARFVGPGRLARQRP